jgi:predicted metalloprotease with PDZ domain
MISYKMAPVAEADGTRTLEVKMRFRGDADGETTLELPSSWAGADELWRHIVGLEIRGAERLAGFYDAPVIHHRPGGRIKVRYKLASAWQEDPGFDYDKARPMVRPDWFFVHGEGAFALPQGREAAPARFRWGRIPRGWKVASDLDHLRREPSTAANLINSVAIGGRDLQVIEKTLGRSPLRLAILGKWEFEPQALADTVAPIVAATDAFWGEESTPFLVAMAPLGTLPSGLSYTGTGRTDAFSIASTSAFPLKDAKRFLAHEYQHSWVPIMLGASPETDALDYWFSEGFADYLAAKVLLRSGLWTLEEFVADKNTTLLRYGTSPAKTLDAEEVAMRFWMDPAVQQVSYDRGHLLAAKVDAEIAGRTDGAQSLDTVLRAQRATADGSLELATTLFRRKLIEKTGIDIEPDVDRHARRGEAIALAEDLFGDCARIVFTERREFHRGFDSRATRLAGGIAAGVQPDGPAFAAGMRDGMRIMRLEGGTVGDSSTELVYRIADEAGERVIRYLPEGKKVHRVQQIELTAIGADREAACKARLAGRQ